MKECSDGGSRDTKKIEVSVGVHGREGLGLKIVALIGAEGGSHKSVSKDSIHDHLTGKKQIYPDHSHVKQ